MKAPCRNGSANLLTTHVSMRAWMRRLADDDERGDTAEAGRGQHDAHGALGGVGRGRDGDADLRLRESGRVVHCALLRSCANAVNGFTASSAQIMPTSFHLHSTPVTTTAASSAQGTGPQKRRSRRSSADWDRSGSSFGPAVRFVAAGRVLAHHPTVL